MAASRPGPRLGYRWCRAATEHDQVMVWDRDVSDDPSPESMATKLARVILTGSHPAVLALRKSFRKVPADPRCKLCHAPFRGVGGFVLRPWFGPWERNAQLCKNCMRSPTRAGVGGTEVELSMMFADNRDSSGLGEWLSPADFSALLNPFYRLAAAAITSNDGRCRHVRR